MNRMACSRVTEGKPLRKSSRVEFPSIWSMRAWTGTRVPLKQGTPLIRSRSTQTISSSWTLCSAVMASGYSKSPGRASRRPARLRGSQTAETTARKRLVDTRDLQRTAEALVDEVTEYYEPFEKLRRKLRTQKRGSQAYQDTLTELETASAVLRTKAEHACQGIDEVIESLPD